MLSRTFKILCLLISSILYTQSGLENILLAGQTDSKNLFNGYLQPVMKGSIYLMNSGWYSTAKVHKKFGFDLTLSLNSVLVPDTEKSFDISSFNFIESNANSLPTIFGESINNEVGVIIPKNNIHPQLFSSFLAPGGIKDKFPLGFVSSPSIQASLGLPFRSEITLRYLPKYNRNRIYFSSYGFGLKHDLLQYFKFFNKIPALSLSAFAAVSFMNINYDIQSTKSFNGSNQAATFDISNYKFKILSSLNLSIFEIYAGLGISGGKSSFELLGNYELELYAADDNNLFNINISDPFRLNYSINELSKNIGLKFKLIFLHAFIDYTLQEYDVISVGALINFR